MLNMDDRKPSKGIFWFTCSFDGENECVFSEAELIARLVPCDRSGQAVYMQDFNSRKGNAFNHKATWASLVKNRKDLRKHAWNYFPRGRVEIAGSKATIYLNINIIRHAGFQDKIVERFHLGEMKVRVVVDNSRHYYCHAEDDKIL